MRRSLVLICGVLVAMAIPATADATITTAFNNDASPITCSVQAVTNYRVCGGTANTKVSTWDNVPIDVTVTFPADAGGSDNNFPVIGLFHGWGGSKIIESNTAGNTAKRWVDAGYAVFSMSDRGWGSSCGGSNAPDTAPKPAPCTNGFIHLMANAYEVRDAQYLMGMLADDGLIDPTKIGVNGGSYGGGISAQLAMLNDRTELADGSMIAWESPADSIPMSIAAAIPEYTWSNLPSALLPNGSAYDYAADNPYQGPNGDHRIGGNKQTWNGTLNLAGTALGYYAPSGPGPDFPDPKADIKSWFQLINTGGPYDGNATATSLVAELSNHHSSYGIDDSSTTPAPMLLTSGWNDDLFPASESLRLYNKIRADYPSAPVQFYGLDYGHQPRSNGTNLFGNPDTSAAAFAADYAGLVVAGNAWMDYYVKGTGAEPNNAVGGVTLRTSKCSGNLPVAGTTYTADKWANLAHGEVAFGGSAGKTISPSTNSATTYVGGTSVCTDSASAADTNGAASYTSPAAPAGGYTIAGAATVDFTINNTSANNMVFARLYDVDPTGSPTTEKMIARGVYRPLNVGEGAKQQTFQLFQQGWTVENGHQLKLELLGKDSPYMQTPPGQQPIDVSNLTVHVPTIEAAGDLGGFIKDQGVKILPAGYSFSQDVLDLDTAAPTTTDNVPAAAVPTNPAITLTATDSGVTGVQATHYTTGVAPATPTMLSPIYDPAAKPVLANGETISYFSVDFKGNAETPHTSGVVTVVPYIPPVIPPVTPPVTPPTLSKLAVSVKTKGSIKVGKTVKLTLSSKAYGSKVSSVKYRYKWTAGSKTVGKKSSLKLTKSMKGKKIKVVVTATKAGYAKGTKTITVTKKLK